MHQGEPANVVSKLLMWLVAWEATNVWTSTTVGHCVTGLIAKPTILEAFSRERSLHRPVALAGELAILPLRDVDLDSFLAAPCDYDVEEFNYLSRQLIDVLRRASHHAVLMYFETNYFGGVGGQGAAVFCDGDVTFGPRWGRIGTINGALKLLDTRVVAPALDEFETVGLHRHRATSDWLEVEP
jgi:hypothetical protein